jgi:uncharacterized protein with GYD domain
MVGLKLSFSSDKPIAIKTWWSLCLCGSNIPGSPSDERPTAFRFGRARQEGLIWTRLLVREEDAMKTFVLMTKLSPEMSQKVKERARLGRAWLVHVKEKCPEVRFLSHYAMLGPWDFLDIYEAPDEETAAKVSLISLANGAFQAESWTAIPYKRFIELTESI